MDASDSSPTIKLTTGQKRQNRCQQIFSFPVRLTLEIVFLLLIFVPLFLFAFKWTGIENRIREKVLEKVRLAPNSDGNESWVNSPAVTRRAYRLYNITNYMEVMTSNENPTIKFKETEPFLYRLTIKKNNIEWLENNTKIHYSVERFFTRDGEFSTKLLEQEGAFVDILRAMFRTKFGRVADSLFYVLGGNNAFNYSKAIDKLEGYVSPIFAAISARMQGPNREKYGFIYRYNGSNGYNFTIETGIDNTSIKGQMIDFQSEYTSFIGKASDWNMPILDGLTFPPIGDPPNRRVINVFQADVCRPVQLRYNRTVSKFGFRKLHEYVLKLIDLDDCPSMDETCNETDRIDISKCFSNEIPTKTLFLSKPHLFGHDSSSTNVAFQPNEEKHESTILFEPTTGSPIRAQLRIQLNLQTQIDRLKVLNNGETEPTRTRASSRFIPMVWIDQTISLNDDVLNRLRTVNKILYGGHDLHQSMGFTSIFVGLISLLGIFTLLEVYIQTRTRTRNRAQNEKDLDEQEKQVLSSENDEKS